MDIEEFCKQLPKIELHAHLNGSLSEKTLKQLGCLDEDVSQYQKLTKLLNTSNKTLEECFQLFDVAYRATASKESVYIATASVIEDFHNDNVVYLELRTTPRCENNMTKTEYIESVISAIRENTRPILVKLLLSINRRHDLKNNEENIKLCVEMKNKYPNIIKGVDLSGNPSIGRFNKNLFEEAVKHDLYVSLHCAEIKNDEEVSEMLDFKPHRLGHGTFLHPCYGGSEDNWKKYKKHKIPIVCGTSRSLREHHVQEWIKNSLPFTLSTDDKGVFCTTLSQEFHHIAKHFGLSREDLWQISLKSINYSFASNEEKQNLKKTLEQWKSKQQF